MFRLLKFNNRSTTEIQAQFSEELSDQIGISNIRILGTAANTAPLVVKSVRIKKSVISIVCSSQVPNALYYVEFLNSDDQKFESSSGEELQDSERLFYFLGQEAPNSIRDNMLSALPATYDVESDTTVRKLLSGTAEQMLAARADIIETGNANYISETIVNESKIRGYGAQDRLNNEGAYEILRVAKTPVGSTQKKTFSFTEQRVKAIIEAEYALLANPAISRFPSDPFSLQSVEVVGELVSNAEEKPNSFDGLTITLSNQNVAVLLAAKLIKTNGTEIVYDIPKYGYAINSNRYDSVCGRPLSSLKSNQIRLADLAILDNAFEVPSGNDVLEISYLYRDLGINLTSTDISISKVIAKAREPTIPLAKVFSLKGFPIVLSNDRAPTFGGVEFLDPAPISGTPYASTHPAFVNEIPFDALRLPSGAGEFSINYETGQVFVYGAASNSGTGNVPPVASYYFRKTFKPTIDFNLDVDEKEIVAVPDRSLTGDSVKISYNVEQTLTRDVDWKHESHQEIINEYVENRFVTQAQITTGHAPITDVFEVLNETTGERYAVNRFDSNHIYFSGRALPRFVEKSGERARLRAISNEQLLISEEMPHTVSTKIFKIDLSNKVVASRVGQYLGANTNSSVVFGSPSIFQKEYFFDDLQTLAQNLAKLSTLGDYIIDYIAGTIYVIVELDASYDVGGASYTCGTVEPTFEQIISVNDVGYRKAPGAENIANVNYLNFETDAIGLANLKDSVERFYLGDTERPLLLGTVQHGVAGQTVNGDVEFLGLDGNFTDEMADGYHILRIAGEADRQIISISNSKTLVVDAPFDSTQRSLRWTIIDFNLTDGYQIVLTNDIDRVNGIYTLSELQSVDRSELTNYYDPRLDIIDGNTIVFNNSMISTLAAGTALAVDYSYGTLFVDYTYSKDVVRISYEYGDNSINFGISDALQAGDEYFVTYRYGALREKLLHNFGQLTNIDELMAFPIDFDREVYRDFIGGTLQAFVNGPTVESTKALVQRVTEIEPEVRELTFNEWTAGRDNLYLQNGKFIGAESYVDGRFGDALRFGPTESLSFPSESYISYRDGTFEAWVAPDWSGIDNDASLSFTVSHSYESIFIGASAWSPDGYTFSLSRFDPEPKSPIGRPINYLQEPGTFIWFDESTNKWNYRSTLEVYGKIESSGGIVDASGICRSSSTTIAFFSDGYISEAANQFVSGFLGFDAIASGGIGFDDEDGDILTVDLSFRSDNTHYLIDAGPSEYHNRISVFKDPSGFLNFKIWDDGGRRSPHLARSYTLSSDISEWLPSERHFVAASWRLNSVEGIDEMHLFIDGKEVANTIKYGGRPIATNSDLFRSIAKETVETSAARPVVGRSDGATEAGSDIFSSATANFESNGIEVGDLLSILDPTADGAGGPYEVIGVGELSVQIDQPLLLTLDDVKFSINQIVANVATNVDMEKFAVVAEGDDGERELNGIGAELPDYSIYREAGLNYITIDNNVDVGDNLYINTFGLLRGRHRETIFVAEDGYSLLRASSPPPVATNNFEAFKLINKRTIIDVDGYHIGEDGGFLASGNSISGSFTGFPQPSNEVNGKSIAFTISGTNNIDFDGINEIKIYGTTFGGDTSETIAIDEFGRFETENFFTSIDQIDLEFTTFDPSKAAGAIEIIESRPFTQSENDGNFAQLKDYNNGVFEFIIALSGGLPFELEGNCHYLIDYPTTLNIPMQTKGQLIIGNSITGSQGWCGSIDQVTFLNEVLEDIRPGESKDITRTVTQDYNSPVPLSVTPQTLMLINFNGKIDNVRKLYQNFTEASVTSPQSVNTNFADAAIFLNDEGVKIDNGSVVFNNTEGSIEFWVSPLLDALFDENVDRYYVDITSSKTVRLPSKTALTIELPTRASSIRSVRLIGEPDGTDYFVGGKLNADGKTIILGSRLPSSQTTVEISFVPLDFNGDRFSIFKSSNGYINFAITASDQLFMISYPVEWYRNTWHRVMATWKTNSIIGKDTMRLFVDGAERGTITWGSPNLIYGGDEDNDIPVAIYGQALVGAAGSNALLANIDLKDTFSDIVIGNTFDGRGSAAAKIDNLRFSNKVRSPAIIGNSAVDLNYNENLQTVLPVIEDNFTTKLLDFDKSAEETNFVSNLLYKTTPLFQIDVEVDDSFGKIKQQRYKDLLSTVLDRLKPAHTRLFTNYVS
jgi:hypothetical protein